MSEPIDPGVVYIVDDDPSICSLLEAIINGAGLKTKCFATADDFVNSSLLASPGCILLDLELPGISGIEWLERRAGTSAEQLPVIVLTGHGSVRTAVKSLQLGAVDFLEKPFEKEVLLERVQAAIATDRDRRRANESKQDVSKRLASLSPRERELLAAVIEGKSTKMIADGLGISARTVDHHRANLMEKMHAANVADLVRMALEAGFPPKKK
jgi:RNA polymerase sigma factor (sigma-70 family)